MSSFSIDIPVFCGTCGGDLEAKLDRQGNLEVSACDACVKTAEEVARKEGYRAAEKDNGL